MTTPGSGSSPVEPPEARRAGPPPSGHASGSGLNVPTDVFSGSWPSQAADTIVGAVDTVRDKTTGPAQTAARGLVYGILVVVLGTVVAVLVIIGAIRLLDAVQPWGNVWLPYLELGLLFLVGGLFVFRRRRLVGA